MIGLDWRLSAPQVADLLGINYQTLNYWLKTDLVTCQVPAEGRGSVREFNLRDVVRVRVVAELRRHNVSLQAIRKALDLLESHWGVEDPLPRGAVVQAGGRIYYAPNQQELWDVLKRQRAAKDFVMIDAQEIAQDVSDKVRGLCAA
jgi:DNA-binding transcriptional MerR regulator